MTARQRTVLNGLRRLTDRLNRGGRRKLRLPRNPGDAVADEAARPSWLYAPVDHPLAAYQNAYPLYDRMLPQMACVVGTLRPGRCLIDVGANIGDTAALVRLAGAKQRIICVEASKRFFDLMTENVALYRSFYGEIELVRAFVGSPDTGVVLREARGSARLVQGAEADDIPIVGLADVARGRRVGLVKLDTDGFDWQIILQGIDWLRKELPVLWVEAEITSRPGLEGWCRALRELSRDYAYVFAFDNFGFPLASFPLNEPTQNALGQLFQYTWKSTNHRRTISYMDLCFVPARETELVDAFEARVNQVLVNSGYA